MGRILAATIATLAMVTPAAAAVSVPAASSFAYYDYYRLSQPGTYVANHRVDGDGSAPIVAQNPGAPAPGLPSARTVVDPTGFVNLRSALTSATDFHSDAGGSLNYSFVIGGSGYTGIVPIRMIATLQVAVTGNPSRDVAVADANLYVSTNNGTRQWRAALCTSSCVGAQPSSVDIDTVFGITVGQIVSITESVSTEAINGGSAMAYADPYFFIDPAFLADHSGLSLTFSRFVGNEPAPSAAPEPASWAMMTGGFGAIGLALRGKRKRATAPA